MQKSPSQREPILRTLVIHLNAYRQLRVKMLLLLNLLSFLERYYGYFPFGDPHPKIKRAQERLNAMEQLQGQLLAKGQPKVLVEAALYQITITEGGRLECAPRWFLTLSEVAQLLGISRAFLYGLLKEGDFPVLHLHNKQYVRVESLLVWIYAKEHLEREQAKLASASAKRKRSSNIKAKSRRRS